jgi:hypothetical protein
VVNRKLIEVYLEHFCDKLASPSRRPNAERRAQNEVGTAVKLYGFSNVESAMNQAVARNARTWAYVVTILESRAKGNFK